MPSRVGVDFEQATLTAALVERGELRARRYTSRPFEASLPIAASD
jgi:hypothetical protein